MENEKELIRRLHVVRQQGGAFFFFLFFTFTANGQRCIEPWKQKEKEERLREQHPGSCIYSDNKEIWARKLALRAPAVTRATSSSSLTGMRFQEHYSQSVDDVQGRSRFSLTLSLWPPAQTSLNLCGGKGKRAEKGVCTRTLSFCPFPWPGLDGNPPLRGTNWWSRSKEIKKKVKQESRATNDCVITDHLCAWRLPVLISPFRLRRADKGESARLRTRNFVPLLFLFLLIIHK